MRDVAEEAGVSAMTVSNVLTGRRVVSPATRRRVLDVVERTGYRVNAAARSLRRGRTSIVGLAVPELHSHYFGQLADRFATRLAQEGLRVVVEQTGASPEGEQAAITASRVGAYDGLVLSAVGLAPDDVQALVGDLPVVVLGERQDVQRFDHVEMANADGAAAAARLLLDRGCRRLVGLGMPPLEQLDSPVRHSEDAFRLRALGLRAQVREVRGATATSVGSVGAGSNTLAAGAKLAQQAVELHPRADGIVCATDTIALGALRRLTDLGVRVPHDVLVIGFDDVVEAAYSTPSLSSVAPGHTQMVEATVRLLLRRMADREAPAEHVVSPFTVVERETTRG